MSESGSRRGNPVSRFFRMLIEARWFFTFSASATATIVGISLTFGINSCRETRKARREMEKSLIQASDNLAERMEEAEKWIEILASEDRIYERADSILTLTGSLPDSVSVEFYNSLPYIRLSSFDHEFEKIFRGSYQLWQLQNRQDSLIFYIGQCYDGLNIVESTCDAMTEGMLEQIGIINSENQFYRSPSHEWTRSLVSNPRFQYFMSVRTVKINVARSILSQVKTDYESHVLPLSESLRKK